MNLNAIDFCHQDWVFERSSGYAGMRHIKTQQWIYEEDYFKLKAKKLQYEQDLKLLHDFRLNCLPFGNYPDCVLLKFLSNRYMVELR